MVKSIIKRIIVGVGIILCLSFISSLIGSIPFNVYAESDIPFRFGVLNSSGSPTTINNKDGIYSNIFINSDENSLNVFNYYLFSVDTATCNNGFCDRQSYPEGNWLSYNNLNGFITPLYYSPNNTTYIYMGSINYMFDKQFILKNNNSYTIFLAINKRSNYVRFNSVGEIELSGLNVTLDSGLSEYNILPYVDNLEVEYHIYHEEIGSQSNWAYISLSFNTPSNFDSFFNGDDIYLSSVLYDINAPSSAYSNIEYPFNSLLYFANHNSNNVSISNYLFVLENGSVYYTGVDCNENSNSCHSGSGYTGSMDYTNFEDIEVINSIPLCNDSITSLSDLGCYIDRVFSMISNFFTRFGNFFKDIFNDSITWDLDTNSDLTPVSSLLTMPITLLNSFMNGFDSSCTNYSFGSLYGTNIILPCINISNYLGSTLWGIIDGLFALFMCFNIGKLIITFFDKATSLEDMFSYLYHSYEHKKEQSSND